MNDAPSLRVGVVVGDIQPQWVEMLRARLRGIPAIDVRLISVAAAHSRSLKPAWLMDRLYSASRARFDPFGKDSYLERITVSPNSLDAIREANCGLLIWLAGLPNPDLEVEKLSKHGVFTVQFGESGSLIPFWDEVARSNVTTISAIFWHDASFGERRMVRKAETSTSQGLYFTSNAEQPLVAVTRMLAALCEEVLRGGSEFEERVRDLAPQRIDETFRAESPSNLDAAGFVAKKLARSAHLRWKTRGKSMQWFIAMRANRGESVTDPKRLNMEGFVDVPLPPGVKAMADPFPVEIGCSQYLLFEELAVGKSRGRIACMEIRQDGSCGEMKIILERPHHLSYPCIVRQGGDIFLLPETAEANRIELHRFSRFPSELEFVSAPIEDAALVDTTPVLIDDVWYFFSTTKGAFKETLLFSAPRLEGRWKLHPCSPVSSSVRNCRGAGHLFWQAGRLFRPTQDCSVRSGYAIVINEVTKLTPNEFEEHAVSYLAPSWRPGLLGTHTWNEISAFQVIDGIRFA